MDDKIGTLKKIGSPLDGIDKVSLKFIAKKFRFEFDANKYFSRKKKLDLVEGIKKVEFEDENKHFILGNIYFDGIAEGEITDAYSKGFSKRRKFYYKLMIPLSRSMNFHFTLDTLSFSRLGTLIKLFEEDLAVIQIKDDNENHFLVIVSKMKQSYEEFADKTFAVRVALGYVTGLFAGNTGYFFSYSNKKLENFIHFYYCSLRSEIKTFMNPINTNPFAWILHDQKNADKILKQKKLRTLSQEEFSKLCNLLMKNDSLLATLLLIIESGKASLIFRPSGYAIALESLAQIILGDDVEKNCPITSKPLSRKFRKELNEVLDKYVENEHFKDVDTLRGKITHINQVTNKEKLTKPFKLLSINIDKEDEIVIGSRNDFLHGRVPDYKKLGDGRSIELKDKDLHYASLRLYTLVNLLIFKFIGFDNYLINFAKIYERHTGYKLKEEYYRKA
ncbi:hypothetical protein ACX0HA_17355 [Flavobacterium hauense]